MAVFTRSNGNAQNVVSVGNITLSSEASSINVIISTGIGKPIQAFAINSAVAMTTELGTGDGVETLLRVIGSNATILAYQVCTANNGSVANGLLSVLTEESAWTATTLQADVRAATASTFNTTGITVVSPGLQLVG